MGLQLKYMGLHILFGICRSWNCADLNFCGCHFTKTSSPSMCEGLVPRPLYRQIFKTAQKLCRMGEHQHLLAHHCSPREKFSHTWNVKFKHNGIWEWGISGLLGGAFLAYWLGHLWFKWVRQLWQSKLLFRSLQTFDFWPTAERAALSVPACSEVKCQVGEHQHWLAHQCSPCAKFAHMREYVGYKLM